MPAVHGSLARVGGLVCLVACGSSGGSAFDGGAQGGDATVDGGGGSEGGSDASGGSDGIGNLGDGAVPDAGSCTPPDVLVVLDHTDSMSDTPNGTTPPNTPAGHALTKWYLATQAVKAVVAPPADQKIAFGLEPFPLDPQTVDAGGAGCKTLTQLLGGNASTNKQCQPGEALVPPAPGTGAAITAILDPETFRRGVSTPIALAPGTTAQAELKAIAKPGVAQYVLPGHGRRERPTRATSSRRRSGSPPAGGEDLRRRLRIGGRGRQRRRQGAVSSIQVACCSRDRPWPRASPRRAPEAAAGYYGDVHDRPAALLPRGGRRLAPDGAPVHHVAPVLRRCAQ